MSAEKTSTGQMAMPGMPVRARLNDRGIGGGVAPGTVVLYMGNVSGGPKRGECGVVRRSNGRRVLVDMGRSGNWHIPYYFLAVPSKAA